METTLSANTLFHFTTGKIALSEILSSGFYVRYCLENYENLIDGNAELVLPMVSFCDIPLSQVAKHTSTYGKYALGLTKAWGMKNKINPVIYSYPNSTTADSLNRLRNDLGTFLDIRDLGKDGKLIKRETKSLIDLLNDSESKISNEISNRVIKLAEELGHFLKYIKPYEGKFYRGEGYLDKPAKFYEEREWRYSPQKKLLDEAGIKDSYIVDFYTDKVKRRYANLRLANADRLRFKPADIRFIIVNKDDEIPGMLLELEKIFGNSSTYNELKLLGTRLISLEQILEDL